MLDILEENDKGVILRVKVKTSAKENKLQGVYIDNDGEYRLKLSVTTAPENGKANSKIIKLLAKSLKIAKSDITIIKGKTNSYKTLLITADKLKIGQILATKFNV